MSEIKVNKISPRIACGTTTLGDSGDTFTIPAGVSITNNGTATGFGATGAVNWDVSSIKTTGFTATVGIGYFCNTSAGSFTVSLPAGTAGDIVAFSDYTRTFQTYALTILPNGSEKIGGVAQTLTLNVEGQATTLVYVDAAEGWINVQNAEDTQTGDPPFLVATGGCITNSGDYRIHTFLSPGTFNVTNIAPGPSGNPNALDYLVVAGGGGGGSGGGPGGGSGASGAGGGAGGYRESPGTATGSYTVSPRGAAPAVALTAAVQPYPIDVGGGGAGVTPGITSNPGLDSTFSSITAAGGGGGGTRECTGPIESGKAGGSGGGEAGCLGSAGAGNTPPTNPAQGTNGGDSLGPNFGGGGGGGAVSGPPGNNATPGSGGGVGGVGGTGGTNAINTASTTRGGGGGGGGGGDVPSGHDNAGGAGGPGGGGAGGKVGVAGSNATINTGGGGGAGGANPGKDGANGGSGIVIIRYKYQ